MFTALKKILGIRETDHIKECAEPPLFSGSAYFSNLVPRTFIEEWVAHGGEISSGTTLDVRARYFFAIDPSEPWVTKLFAKSVLVIHAGWILHCVDEAFQVPISEYILDAPSTSNAPTGRFVPEFPYKLTGYFAPPMYVPLSEPEGPIDIEPGESGQTLVQTSDTPSTPTSIPRKRNREQAYFDSPSGSLVFSGFDKDGMPRRPRKQRRLRFDLSFSPDGGRSSRGVVLQGAGPDCIRDRHVAPRDDDDVFGGFGGLDGVLTTVRSPDTPDKLLADAELPASYRRPSIMAHISNSQAISTDKEEEAPPVRTIDFTNLPPPTRRFLFPATQGSTSGDTATILMVVKSTDNKVKTPKKISFANHARVRVYTTISPRRPDARDDRGVGPAQQGLRRGVENGLRLDDKTRASCDEAKGSDDSTGEATQDCGSRSESRADFPRVLVSDDPPRHNGNQSENDVLALRMEEVRRMRRRLLESAEKNGVSSGQLATLFELGKTHRGMAFHHVW